MNHPLSTQFWGSFKANDEVLALICPKCGAFVTTAADPATGMTGKETHIEFHREVEK